MDSLLHFFCIITSSILVHGITGQSTSPCPDIFQYIAAEETPTTWSGEITIKTDVELSGIYLRLIFDKPPLEVTANFGEVVQREATQFLVRRPGYKVAPSSNEKVHITVSHSGDKPLLEGFNLNAKRVCPAEAPSKGTPGIVPSPCPYVFTYDPPGAENDVWTGVLTLTSESELSGIYSRLSFDKPPLEVSADFGDVVQRETNQFLIRKPGHILPVGTALRINLKVKFNPAESAPRISNVQLNAKSICPAPLALATPPPIAKGLVSPCPGLFNYLRLDKDAGKWYGQIILNNKYPLNDWTLTVILDRPSLQLGDWKGYLRTQDNIEYQLTRPGVPLNVGVTSFNFFIKYKTSRPYPKLAEIQLNKQGICPEDDTNLLDPVSPQIVSQVQTSNPAAPPPPAPAVSPGGSDDDFFTGSLNHFKKHGVPLGLNREFEDCGITAQIATPFITHGMETIPGQHPWHAALYHNRGINLTYICGANLISKKYALTAAHCATKPSNGRPHAAGVLVVVLGKYFLERLITNGIQERTVNGAVMEIIVHPKYNKDNFRNDLALLRMEREIAYTDTVRPVCLWQEDVNIDKVIGQQGVVVGWGWNENGQLSDQLIKTNMPIVTRLTCILSHPDFFAKFTSDDTYCAGFKNGSSACNGDSGGGMVLPRTHNGRTVWFLRGVVSLGVALQNLDQCDPSHYVVFTDIAKYTTWINDIIRR